MCEAITIFLTLSKLGMIASLQTAIKYGHIKNEYWLILNIHLKCLKSDLFFIKVLPVQLDVIYTYYVLVTMK